MRISLTLSLLVLSFLSMGEDFILFSHIEKGNYYFSKVKSDFWHARTIEVLNVDNVRNSLAFEKLKSPALNKGPLPDYHWIKFNLVNDFDQREKVFLTLKNSAINNIRYFVVRKSIIDSCITGDNYPFEQRPYPFCNFSFPLELEANDSVQVYLELDKRNENFFCAFDLRIEEDFHQMEMSVYLIFGLFTGIIMLSIVLNLILYFGVKENSHLWYSLYAFSNLFLILAYDGMDFQFLYPEVPFFSNISRYFFTGTTYILLFTLFSVFVLHDERNPRLRMFCSVMKGIHLFLILSSILIFAINDDSVWMKITLFRLLSLISTISMLSFIVISIFKVRQGSRDAILFLAATSLLFLGGLEYVLNINGYYTGLLLFNSVIPSNMQLVVVVEVLLVFIAIALKFKDYKRQSMEMRLAIVTSESLMKDKELALVNEERKRIARDLHDGVGSILFGVRMKLQAALMTRNIENNALIELSEDLDGVSEGIRSVIWRLNQHRSFVLMVKSLVDHAKGIFEKRNLSFEYNQDLSIERLFHEEFRRDFSLMFLEICNNTNKHSKASSVFFDLSVKENLLIFNWKEDLIENAFNQETHNNVSGLGLKSIQDRITLWDGQRVSGDGPYHYLVCFPLEKILE